MPRLIGYREPDGVTEQHIEDRGRSGVGGVFLIRAKPLDPLRRIHLPIPVPGPTPPADFPVARVVRWQGYRDASITDHCRRLKK
jgi:hypothetical protein